MATPTQVTSETVRLRQDDEGKSRTSLSRGKVYEILFGSVSQGSQLLSPEWQEALSGNKIFPWGTFGMSGERGTALPLHCPD